MEILFVSIVVSIAAVLAYAFVRNSFQCGDIDTTQLAFLLRERKAQAAAKASGEKWQPSFWYTFGRGKVSL